MHVWYGGVRWENGGVVRSMGITCKAGELECSVRGQGRGRGCRYPYVCICVCVMLKVASVERTRIAQKDYHYPWGASY